MATRRLLGLLGWAAVLAGGAARGDEALQRRGVEKLFAVGWEGSPTARAAADQVQAKIVELRLADARTDYAWTLVLLKQRRYPEAAAVLDALLADRPSDLPALRARLWAAMLLRDYPGALAVLNRLAEALPEGDSAAAEGDAPGTLRSAGRALGFLERPAGEAVSAADLRSCRERLAARLGPAHVAALEAGRREVIERYSTLTVEREDTVLEEAALAAAEQERLQQDIAARQAEIAAFQAEAGPERERIEVELKEQLAELEKQLRPINTELTQVTAQAAILRNQRSEVRIAIASLQAQAARERDPLVRAGLLTELDRRLTLANQLDTQGAVLQTRGTQLLAAQAQLQGQANQAQAQAAGELGQLDQDLQALEEQARKLEGQAARAEKPTSGSSGRVRALAREAEAFTTYDEFPLEAERERVLKLFVGG